MKKIGLIIMFAFANAIMFAQVPNETDIESTPPNTIQTYVGYNLDNATINDIHQFAPQGGVVMWNGNVLMVKENRAETLKSDVSISTGATISPSGKVTFKDGSSTMLREGQCVGMDGAFFNVGPTLMDISK